MNRPSKPLAVRIGDAQVLMIGRRSIRLADPYPFVLNLSWPQFFALLVLCFLLINALFGLVYSLDAGSVANARPGHFIDYFFFSIETLATVGYGSMAPANTYGHVVSSLEILLGMVSLALVTGLVFARFSRPRARIAFSSRLVIRDFDGERMLMMRVANERENRIMEATASMSLVRNETTAEGEQFARIYDLPLVRANSPVFALTWTLMHRIDLDSPISGCDAESLTNTRARLIVNVAGHDETMAAPVYATKDYTAEDIAFEHRFADVVSTTDDGQRLIDLTHFDEIEPLG